MKDDTDLDHLKWFPGGGVAEVDPGDIESVLQLFGGVQPASDDHPKATGHDLAAQVCTAGADVRSVCYRAWMLQMCARLDLLSPWLHDGVLDEAVINVAATFPMEEMEVGVVRDNLPFDVEEFVKQVKAEAGK